MQGKILIVDAIATNRIVLKVKLKKAYYDVLQVATMAEALELACADAPDLVICALELPDGGAAALSVALSKDPLTEHLPIMAVGSQPDAATRLATLAAGVRDVLSQPLDETLLLGRVRSLIRAHNAAAEWQMREDTCRALGLSESAGEFEDQGRCVLISSDTPMLQRHARDLRREIRCKLSLSNAPGMMQQLNQSTMPDVFILVLPAEAGAALVALGVISTLRANAQARHAGVIVVQTTPDMAMGANALDLGADDLMTEGFDAAELALRTRALLRRKRMSEQIRATMRTNLQAAVFDPLTGLYNRRYAMPHLGRIVALGRGAGRRCAVMALDLDHFKHVNDVYGHAAGDAVLIEVANRLRSALRNTDMVARIGGEEFMVIMPGTTKEDARNAALRICGDISSKPFEIPGGRPPIEVTISIGMAVNGDPHCATADPEEMGQALLAQADKALYAAKGRGRNQVKLGRPAA